jgi:hypothetical protein
MLPKVKRTKVPGGEIVENVPGLEGLKWFVEKDNATILNPGPVTVKLVGPKRTATYDFRDDKKNTRGIVIKDWHFGGDMAYDGGNLAITDQFVLEKPVDKTFKMWIETPEKKSDYAIRMEL